jgi:hypothetical protein
MVIYNLAKTKSIKSIFPQNKTPPNVIRLKASQPTQHGLNEDKVINPDLNQDK